MIFSFVLGKSPAARNIFKRKSPRRIVPAKQGQAGKVLFSLRNNSTTVDPQSDAGIECGDVLAKCVDGIFITTFYTSKRMCEGILLLYS